MICFSDYHLLSLANYSSTYQQVDMAPTKKDKVVKKEKNEEAPTELKKEEAPTKEKKEGGKKNNGAHLRASDHLKKPRKEPTGKPRGRRPGQKNKKTKNTEIWLRNLRK